MRLPAGVPDGLKPILAKALAREPADRYQTATEFLDALLDHLFHEQIRVSTQDMGRFMKSVFAKEIDEERARSQEWRFWEAPHWRRPDGSVTNW